MQVLFGSQRFSLRILAIPSDPSDLKIEPESASLWFRLRLRGGLRRRRRLIRLLGGGILLGALLGVCFFRLLRVFRALLVFTLRLLLVFALPLCLCVAFLA